MDEVGVAATLGLIVTKVVDLLRNVLDPQDTVPKAWWNIASFGVGAALCCIWQVNLTTLPIDSDLAKWGAFILSGLAIGGIGAGWHELLDALSASAKRK